MCHYTANFPCQLLGNRYWEQFNLYYTQKIEVFFTKIWVFGLSLYKHHIDLKFSIDPHLSGTYGWKIITWHGYDTGIAPQIKCLCFLGFQWRRWGFKSPLPHYKYWIYQQQKRASFRLVVIQSYVILRGCRVWGFFPCSIGDTSWITVNENLHDLRKHLFTML